MPDLGPTEARTVELMLARHGLLLKDGDPALIERVTAEAEERRRAADAGALAGRDPDQVLRQATEALIALDETEVVRSERAPTP